MLQFRCHGCNETLTSPERKAGKESRCPYCKSAITIPVPPSPAATPVEIEPCPKCGMRLGLLPDQLGLNAECPSCGTHFPAVAAKSKPAGTTARPTANPFNFEVVDDPHATDTDTLPPVSPQTDTKKRLRQAGAQAQHFLADMIPQSQALETATTGPVPVVGTFLGLMLIGGGVIGLYQAITWARIGYFLLAFSLELKTTPGLATIWLLVQAVVMLFLSVVFILQGFTHYRGTADRPPKLFHYLQVATIVFIDPANVALGVVGLVAARHPEVVDYYNKFKTQN